MAPMRAATVRERLPAKEQLRAVKVLAGNHEKILDGLLFHPRVAVQD
jgi:hypothetical protein